MTPALAAYSRAVAKINRRNGVARELMSRDWTTYRGEIAETLATVAERRRKPERDVVALRRMLERLRAKIESASYWQPLP